METMKEGTVFKKATKHLVPRLLFLTRNRIVLIDPTGKTLKDKKVCDKYRKSEARRMERSGLAQPREWRELVASGALKLVGLGYPSNSLRR